MGTTSWFEVWSFTYVRGTTHGRVKVGTFAHDVTNRGTEFFIHTTKPRCDALFDYFNDLSHARVQILEFF